MARATLEMFLKLTGADKTSRGLDKVSKTTKQLDSDVKNSTKQNAEFAAGMSSLTKGAIAGAALFAGKQLLDFARSSITAASAAQEAAGAFGTTFGGAAEQLGEQLSKNANLFGLTTSEAKQLIGVFGAVAQGIGFTQQESADLSSRLFTLAGDIASFNNISAGAEPVLQAFRSALVGENEALKSYGVAISQAEVETKAFEMTGKTVSSQLTRQEKALATTELIFQKAAVQIGNAERESSGFAAQMLIARSSTQELREELGTQLLPAAGEILRTFNEIRTDATPALINRFSDLNLQVLGTVKAFNELRDILTFGNDELETTGDLVAKRTFGIKALGLVLKAYGAVSQAEIAVEKEQIEQSQERIKQFGYYKQNIDAITQTFNKNRQAVLINTVQTAKFGETIDKKLNPIFGEQNALILTNIQLETNRNTLMKLINSANQDLAMAQTNYNNALKEVNRLTIEENVRDAEAAIRKAELLTQIGLLTAAQNNGKDVALDLALAQAELAQVEYELANDSDALIAARSVLTVAEQNLKTAIKNQEKAIKDRNDALILDLELTGKKINQETEYEKKIKAVNAALAARPLVGLGAEAPTGGAVDTPADTVGNQSNVSGGGAGAGSSTVNVEVYIGDEKIDEVVQKSNTRIQEQGKTFAIR